VFTAPVDERQRGPPVRAAHRLGAAFDPGDRRIAAARRAHGHLSDLLRHVWHIARHREDHLVARAGKPGLEAGQRTRGWATVENDPIGHRLFELFRLRERDHHF